MQSLFLMKLCEHGEILCKICHPKEYAQRIKSLKSRKLTKKQMKEFMDAVKLMKNGELKDEQI